MLTICWYFYLSGFFNSLNQAISFTCSVNILNVAIHIHKHTQKKWNRVPSQSTSLVHTTLSIRMNNEARIIVVCCHKRILYIKYPQKPSAYLKIGYDTFMWILSTSRYFFFSPENVERFSLDGTETMLEIYIKKKSDCCHMKWLKLLFKC